MESYETLTEVIVALKEQGYTEDFNVKENCLKCIAARQQLLRQEVTTQ
jgi:ubiquitin